MVPTIKVNIAEYKENKDIFKIFQEMKEWNLVGKSYVMLNRTNWITVNMKLQGRGKKKGQGTGDTQQTASEMPLKQAFQVSYQWLGEGCYKQNDEWVLPKEKGNEGKRTLILKKTGNPTYIWMKSIDQ